MAERKFTKDIPDAVKFRIIEEVKSRPWLWNMNDRKYKDLLLKKREWLEIAEELTAEDIVISDTIVQGVWKNLHDTQRKIFKAKQTGTGLGASDVKWRFWEAMLFTFETNTFTDQEERFCNVASLKTAATDSDQFNQSRNSISPYSQGISDYDDPTSTASLHSRSVSSTPTAFSAPKKRKIEKEVDQVDQSVLNMLKKDDLSSSFGESVTHLHRQLLDKGLQRDAAMFKKAVNDIMFEYEMKLA